ncbi:MAG: phytanoyl-CoA dioxygenase family protein [Akkermansiaceae bacterium]
MPTVYPNPIFQSSQPVDIESGLTLKSRGYDLDTSAEAFGYLNEFTADPFVQMDEARTSYHRDGYLYIKGFWEREGIVEIRKKLTDRMARHGFLKPGTDPMLAIPHPDLLKGINDKSKGSATLDGIVDEVPEIKNFIYEGRIMEFFASFLGGPCLHYDQIWYRAMAPGFGTVPHCDLVYMGRGTHNLFTSWVPWSDIDLRTGGLMILENSRDHEEKIKNYLSRDVDDYCSNRKLPDHLDLEAMDDNKVWGGWLSKNPRSLREKLGGRWLTSPKFEMGDLLTFSMKLVHASLDNQSGSIRISTDTRYQLASEPTDDRWVGETPRGHVGYHKRGRVC